MQVYKIQIWYELSWFGDVLDVAKITFFYIALLELTLNCILEV